MEYVFAVLRAAVPGTAMTPSEQVVVSAVLAGSSYGICFWWIRRSYSDGAASQH
jgi:hypothetical protein